MTGRLRITVWAAVATLGTATALHAVFAGAGWFFPVAGVIVVVFAAAEAVRISRIPDALAPIASAVGGLLYVTGLYAGAPGRHGVVPTADAFDQVAAIARVGLHESSVLTTPVPTHRGVVLLAVVGVAGVAVVVDLFAVTMRRAALAGVPLLAVFAVATAVAKHGAGVVAFLIATVSYLALLLADSRDRLSRWGRSVESMTPIVANAEADGEPLPPPLSILSRRIGVAALAVGAMLPLLIPGMRGGVPQHGSSDGDGSGSGVGSGSFQVHLNPIVTLQGQLQASTSTDLLSYTTDDPDPGYLRLTTLSKFDGTTFSPSPLSGSDVAGQLPTITAPGPVHTTTVKILTLHDPWLPVPVQPTEIDVAGNWQYDTASDTVFSPNDVTEDQTYTVRVERPDPPADDLEATTTVGPTLPDELKRVPATVSSRVRDLTAQVTAQAKTQFDKALAIQSFLTSSQFRYDTSVTNPPGPAALDNFLFVSRAGFCQQYATAMAVMARIAGIPARVAVGFTPGNETDNGSNVVSSEDAHAWPELWFDNYGWIEFEPTPRTDGQVVRPAYALATPTGGKSPDGGGDGNNNRAGGSNNGKGHHRGGVPNGCPPLQSGQTSGKFCTLDHGLSSATKHGRGGHGGAATASSGHLAAKIIGLLLLALLLVTAVLPVTVRLIGRRRRWHHAQSPAERADAAWEELRSTAVDVGADWVDARSARVTARCLSADVPLDEDAAGSLDRLVASVERAWYAAGPTSVGADTLPHDTATVCRALRRDLRWRRRIRAALWPRSARQAIWARIGDATRALDAVDLAGARLRARLRRLGPART